MLNGTGTWYAGMDHGPLTVKCLMLASEVRTENGDIIRNPKCLPCPIRFHSFDVSAHVTVLISD